jgi:hypothetical protein
MKKVKLFIVGLTSMLICSFAAACPEVKTEYLDGSYSIRGTNLGTSPIRSNVCGCKVQIMTRKPKTNSQYDWGGFATFTTPLDIWDRFPKTQIVLEDYFAKNKMCPDQTFFSQVFVIAWQNEIKEQVEKERRQNEQEERALIPARTQLQSYCKGTPRVSVLQIERLSSVLKVHPDSIKLSRVELNLEHIKCKGTFYTPVGARVCEFIFDSSGVVKELYRCE